MDKSLRFHGHIDATVRKASGLANQILRGTVCRDIKFMVSVFVAHIRPILDYASAVWNVGYLCDSRKLEFVLRRWSKQAEGLGNLEYKARLLRMKMFSIHGRLLRSALIKIFKAFNPGVDVGLKGLLDTRTHASTRGHPLKISIPICRSELQRRFWSVRCVTIWNSLPSEVVLSDTVNSFKAQLDVFMGERLYETIDGG